MVPKLDPAHALDAHRGYLRRDFEATTLMYEQHLYADSNTINLETVYTDHTYPT
jgi:hypothetical protein